MNDPSEQYLCRITLFLRIFPSLSQFRHKKNAQIAPLIYAMTITSLSLLRPFLANYTSLGRC
jgi:hypothetical protein